MPTFAYQAVTPEGKTLQGALEASDRIAAVGQLLQRGLVPVAVAPPGDRAKGSWKWAGTLLKGERGLARHRQVFARTLASLLEAGVPLDRSLEVSAELTESAVVKNALQQMLRSVKAGKSLSAAMEAHTDIFPVFYLSMVRASEASGNPAKVFAQLADYQESVNELRGQLTSALVYPVLLLAVGSASVLLLLEFVIPKFAVVFQEAGAALPLPTQVLLAVSTLVRTTWWAWLIGVPLMYLLLHRYLRTAEGRRRWDNVVLAVPMLGSVVERVLVTRFARSLSTLLHGGVPMIRALQIAGEVIGNSKLAKAVERAAQGVKEGRGLTQPLAATGAFPPLSLHMMGVGEETGRLDSMLMQVADVYERETRTALKSLVALFEPLMILVMGLVVGAIVISVLLAIFSINDLQL